MRGVYLIHMKQRINITVDQTMLAAAREMKLNVSAISEAALEAAVKGEAARRWSDENAAAMAERRKWCAENQLSLTDYQVLKFR